VKDDPFVNIPKWRGDMKEVKDLTATDLLDEGRRWVIAPGDYIEGEGYRVEVIFEGYPFRIVIGQITNMPTDLPQMVYFPANNNDDQAQRAAEYLAEQWCLQRHGIDKMTYLDIVSSSMNAYDLGKRVRVLGDHPDRLVIANGFGDEIKLDEEAAIKLYQDLADALDLPCQRTCPKCGGIMEGDECEECGARRTT
jgi:hypothetical protein